ncbi:MAG TPA: hypothetical protein VJ841_04825 [Candidatus Saccharimonadales bacterium]|nr:hypothetical protein [Candidatus Saccharimonadales bacterium]
MGNIMQWALLVAAIVAAIGGTYLYIVERRADRAVANKNADTERLKAENVAERLRIQRFEQTTKRIELELRYSRDPHCSSKTLTAEQQKLGLEPNTELALVDRTP